MCVRFGSVLRMRMGECRGRVKSEARSVTGYWNMEVVVVPESTCMLAVVVYLDAPAALEALMDEPHIAPPYAMDG